MARQGSIPAFRIGDLWRFRASAWTSGSVSRRILKAPLVPLTTKGRSSLFTRTRYQYGSLETKERKKGKEVWEFRYYEPDAQGNDSAGPSRSEHCRSTRPNPLRGSHRRFKRSCYGSTRSSRLRPVRLRLWSRDRTIRAGRNARTVFNTAQLQSYINNHISPAGRRRR